MTSLDQHPSQPTSKRSRILTFIIRFWTFIIRFWFFFRWEWAAITSVPVPWLFGAIFLAFAQAFVFMIGNWLDQNQADLQMFFSYMPWLLLVFVPALVMSAWPDDRSSHRIELLRNQPQGWLFVIARFRALALFVFLVVAATTTLWMTASFLGDPDHGVIISGYLGLMLLAVSYLAIASLISVFSTSPLITFIFAIAINFLLSFSSTSLVQDLFKSWAPTELLDILNQLSPYGQFTRMADGVFSLNSLIYFIGLVAFCLAVMCWRLFYFDRWKIRSNIALSALIALLAVLAFSPDIRWDLSSDKRHTLPDDASIYVSQYAESVSFRLYYSQELGTAAPAFSGIHRRIRQRLEHFQSLNPDQINIEFIRVTPYSAEEDLAIADGLSGVYYDDSGQRAYFGLAVTVNEQNEVLPFIDLQFEQRFDFEFLQILSKLEPRESEPTIGLITSLPITPYGPQGPQSAPVIIKQLDQRYRLIPITSAEQLAHVWPDLLLIVQPNPLDEGFAFAVEQFLLQKGRAVVLLDPFLETIASGAFGPPAPHMLDASNSLSSIFDPLGISIDSEKIAADRYHAEMVQISSDGGYRNVQLPSWIKIDQSLVDDSDPLVHERGTFLLASSGAIMTSESSQTGITLRSLIKTSPDGKLVLKSAVAQPLDLPTLLADPVDDTEYTLAARITGKMIASIPPVALAAQSEGNSDVNQKFRDLATSPADESLVPLDIVLVADVDFIFDRFWQSTQSLFGAQQVTPIYANGFFIAGVVETLMQQFPLSSLRTRQVAFKPFVRLDAMRKTATLALRQEEDRLLTLVKELSQQARENLDGQSNTPLEQDQQELTDEAIDDKLIFEELKQARNNLRNVQQTLNSKINLTTNIIKILHIIIIPVIFVALGLGWCWFRRRITRRKIRRIMSSV